MRNIRLLIEYEGTNYAGWQVQENLPTIQGIIQEKIKLITGEEVRLTGASRTDAGVHALGQAANFHTETKIASLAIQKGLNALLPDDIVIKEAIEVSPDFDARKDAKSKTYKYIVLNRSYPSVIYKNFSWHVFQKLGVDKMKKAGSYLVGKKDFSSFRAVECDAPHSVREILAFSVEKIPFSPPFEKGGQGGLKKDTEGFLEFEVRGTAFLRHMVRIVVGTLVAIGKGKIEVEQFEAIIHAKDRTVAGMTAPSQGLFLKEVEY